LKQKIKVKRNKTKKCGVCGKILLLNHKNFNKSGKSQDGFSNKCRDCWRPTGRPRLEGDVTTFTGRKEKDARWGKRKKRIRPFPKPPPRKKGESLPHYRKRILHLFFEKYITHTSGEWKAKPFRFLRWQTDLVDELFGTIRKDGLRQYREAYVEIAKKNGKTELAAALGLYLLLWDGEGSPEIALAASDRTQASICFKVAAQMVRQNKTLNKHVQILISQKKLYERSLNATLEVVSSETASKHGYNLSGLIFDELHAQKTPDLYEVMTQGSGAARSQPLFLYLTTAGWDKTSICWQIHAHAEEILKGMKKKDKFLPMIYSMPEGADWKDEKNWRAPNPALGEILKLEELRAECMKAIEMPLLEYKFRRLRLNEWTQQEIRWLSIDKWDSCKRKVDLSLLSKTVCFGGLDLSSTQDLTAFVLVFPSEDEYTALAFFFCPEDNIEKRSHKDKIPYDVWAREGLIIPTPGDVIDYSFVLEKIKECKGLYNLKEIGYDRARATELTQKIADEGITVVPISQNQMYMNSPIQELEKLILSGRLNHGGNPILRWMCGNISLKRNAGGLVMFDKKNPDKKIDGMVAMVMGIDRAMRHAAPSNSLIILGPKKKQRRRTKI
jgi:phage terminase large subunit-like protein